MSNNTKLEERIMHSRAFETVIWSVPLMNYKAIRDGYREGAGVGYNDVAYCDNFFFDILDRLPQLG